MSFDVDFKTEIDLCRVLVRERLEYRVPEHAPEVVSGKMLRGRLTCLVNNGLTGCSPVKAADLGCVVELIQDISLKADGWIDGDLMRRGKPSFHLKQSDSETLLKIIYLLSLPYYIIGQYGKEYIEELVVTQQKMSMGVLDEVKSIWDKTKNGLPATRIYRSILEKKTGVLFSLAATYGAMIAGEEKDVVDLFREYGMRLGVAYQIADDISDLEDVIMGNKQIGTERLLLKCVQIDGLVGELIEDVKCKQIDPKKVINIVSSADVQSKLMQLVKDEINSCVSLIQNDIVSEPNARWLRLYPLYCVGLISPFNSTRKPLYL